MLGMIVGTWTTIIGVVYNFHYGSSDGSKIKDQVLAKLDPEVEIELE